MTTATDVEQLYKENEMYIFVFNHVKVTNRNHSFGGLFIVAENMPHAKKLIQQHNEEDVLDQIDQYGERYYDTDAVILSENAWKDVLVYPVDTIAVDAKPKLIVFPDAGCC
jgi:hypothetical protein